MSKTQKRLHESGDSESESEGSSFAIKNLEKEPNQSQRKQCYLKSYTEKWSCLTSSSKGREFVYCTVCKVSFSCAHGGRNDCKKHVEGISHQKLLRAYKENRSIADAFCASFKSK